MSDHLRHSFSRLPDEDAAFLKDDILVDLARNIGSLPGQEPPATLTDGIMRRIKPIRRPLWARAWQWLRIPRTVTITPIRLVPAVAALLALLVIAPQVWSPSQQPAPTVSQLRTLPVQFTLTGHQASSVALIGSFNQWNPKGYEMRPSPDGNEWILDVELPSGRHEYAYLVDGQEVVADPNAVFTKNDGFGNWNSVILVNHDIAI